MPLLGDISRASDLLDSHSSQTLDKMKFASITTGPAETRNSVRALVLMAAIAVIMAVYEWFHPSLPPFNSRHAWLWEWAYRVAGTAGLVSLLLAFAVFMLCVARFLWRHTPKKPSDRWL